MACAESQNLIDFGRKIVEIYYPEIDYACCYLPRVFKANFIGPTGAASGAFKAPEMEASTSQNQLSAKNGTETETDQASIKENEMIENKTPTISLIEEQSSTSPKNLEKFFINYEDLLETQDAPSNKAPNSMEERERLKLEKMSKEQQKKEKFKKKQQQLNSETLTLTVAESIKGEDGEQKVFSMCQENLKEGFVIHGFKYNNGKHKIVKEMDPLMAQLIEEELIRDTRIGQKSKSQKTQPKVMTVPELEIDFIIFHPTKSLCIGEVKAGNDVKKAKKQLLLIEQLMRAVIRRCKEENFRINKLIFLPFGKEDTKGRNHQDDQGFLFVREDSSWWTETPKLCSKLLINPNILYILIGLYAEFVQQKTKSATYAGKDRNNVETLKEQADLALIVDKLGDSLDQHECLNSKYCRSHELRIGLRNEIGFRLNDEQSKIFDDETKHLRIAGPAGSGKSLILKYKAFELASRGEKVGLVVPDLLFNRHRAEVALYGDQLSSLSLISFSDLKSSDDLSKIFDGSRHAFIDELDSLILQLRSDLVSEVRVENLHCWTAGDWSQFFNVSDQLYDKVASATDHFNNNRILTTMLRSTPEMIKHFSSFTKEGMICGNRLHGPPVQMHSHRSYYAQSMSNDFFEFCRDEILKFLRPLRLINSREEIAVIGYRCTKYASIMKKLRQDDWLNRNGFNLRYYAIDQVRRVQSTPFIRACSE